MSQNCKECDRIIVGRSDKIFCSSHCRSSYNNNKARNKRGEFDRDKHPKSIHTIRISVELPICCNWTNEGCICITKIKSTSLGELFQTNHKGI